MSNSTRQRVYFSYAAIGLYMLLNFQNCSQPGAINLSSVGGEAEFSDQGAERPVVVVVPTRPEELKSFVTETFVNTELNTSVEFTLKQVTEEILSGVRLEQQTYAVTNGSLVLVNAGLFKFRYAPNVGFRGVEITSIRALDSKGRKVTFNLKLVVANPIQSLKPALAIRGMGCIQCHAKVESNIITDFGYGSTYYFNKNLAGDWWKSGGIFGDHANSFSTMNLKSSIKVIVPKANLPSAVATATGKDTLAQYIKNLLEKAPVEYLRTRSVEVQAVSKVYIGSPASSDISSAFSMTPSQRSLYFKDAESSLELSGLSDRGNYFKNSGVLNCEGDLALRGPLYLNNLQVNSATGCRIYVIGSVFIYGRILHSNTSEDRNLQITSTEPISLGLGLTKKDNQFCEPESQYAKKPNDNNVSSLVNRYQTFWTTPSYSSRLQVNAAATGAKVVADLSLVESGEKLTILDAACRSEGRLVGFERLLLNAPSVQSRYQGNFIGTIIAESALMRLGQFKFEYDSVFDRVPVLPMLNHKIYLDIEE